MSDLRLSDWAPGEHAKRWLAVAVGGRVVHAVDGESSLCAVKPKRGWRKVRDLDGKRLCIWCELALSSEDAEEQAGERAVARRR